MSLQPLSVNLRQTRKLFRQKQGGTRPSAGPSTGPQKIAEVFEAHPEVLENCRLGNPVVLFSLVLGPVEYGDG